MNTPTKAPAHLLRLVIALAIAAALSTATPALAQETPTPSPTATAEPTVEPTAEPTPEPTPDWEAEPTPIEPDIDVDLRVINYGETHLLAVFGDTGARVDLYGNDRLIRRDVLEPYEDDDDQFGIAVWELQPGVTTTFYGIVDGVRSPSITVNVRRTVTIGISQASGVYTFSGVIARPEAGVQVTVARLDGKTNRVTGVASTKTTADGRYTIRTRLPAGMAGYYALTATQSGLDAGRSRLYGLISR